MNSRAGIGLTGVALAAVFATFSITQIGHGQSPNTNTTSPVKPTVLITGRSSTSKISKSSAFIEAAAQNASLKNDLVWTFGGKQQKGWYLYDLLIRHTLNIESDTQTAEFAEALAEWQAQKGLNPTGVLDEESFMSIVFQWQANRLKTRLLATPDQLVTAPATDFFDSERDAELRQVERNAYAAYKQMVAAALADPALKLARKVSDPRTQQEKYFQIISSFRTREYQERLRRQSPNAGTAGLAINSPHFTGRALDFYVGGDPVDTRDSNRAIQVNSPAYQWLVRNAERFGFRPYFYEPWHWEYVR